MVVAVALFVVIGYSSRVTIVDVRHMTTDNITIMIMVCDVRILVVEYVAQSEHKELLVQIVVEILITWIMSVNKEIARYIQGM